MGDVKEWKCCVRLEAALRLGRVATAGEQQRKLAIRWRLTMRLYAILAIVVCVPSYLAADDSTTGSLSISGNASSGSNVLADDAGDRAFDRYIDVRMVKKARAARDASLLTDLALQLAEGERILLRNHKSGVTFSEIALKAASVAAEKQDKKSMERLVQAAKSLKNEDLVGQLTSLEKIAGVSRAASPGLTVSIEATDYDTLVHLKALVDAIKEAENVSDKVLLSDVEVILEQPSQISDLQKASLKNLIASAREAAPAADDPLAKLAGASRGPFDVEIGNWHPSETIGKIVEGDIVGAIDGADFRIPISTDDTVFSGQSGRRWTMVYSLTNRTSATIDIEFIKSGNRSRIAPGRTIHCRSQASTFGNEKTGVRHDFPQVRATAPNGKWWLRTISRNREDYYVVERGSGVQIVP